MPLTVISHYLCRQHKVPDWFVECPARLDAINNQIISSGLEFVVQQLDAPAVSREQLERVHTAEYLNKIEAAIPESGFNMLSDDLPLSPKTLIAAERAAGAGILAVNQLMTAKTKAVFCNVRPPGHHAEPDRALGFCFYNNIAIAAAHALEEYKLERVAIIDFDVHHGNGTELAYANDERVLMSSIFQDCLFPQHTYPDRYDNTINLAMMEQTTSAQWREMITQRLLPRLESFKPQMIFISAGFDGHQEDDISSMMLNEDDYAWVSQAIKQISDNNPACHGIISCLEGGYNLSALARSTVAHIKALGGL